LFPSLQKDDVLVPPDQFWVQLLSFDGAKYYAWTEQQIVPPSSSAVTISHASPAVVTWTAHGLSAGAQVYFTTTASLPSPLAANTVYYVLASGLTSNTFEVSTKPGGAAVNTTSGGSGTQTSYALANFINKPGGRFGTVTSDPAFEPNGAAAVVGNYVQIEYAYWDATYHAVYTVVGGDSGGPSGCCIETTAAVTVPALGSTVTVSLPTTTGLYDGQPITITSPSTTITGIITDTPTSTTITLTVTSIPVGVPTNVIPVGSPLTLGTPVNPITNPITTGTFVVPTLGTSVNITVPTTSTLIPGQIVTVSSPSGSDVITGIVGTPTSGTQFPLTVTTVQTGIPTDVMPIGSGVMSGSSVPAPPIGLLTTSNFTVPSNLGDTVTVPLSSTIGLVPNQQVTISTPTGTDLLTFTVSSITSTSAKLTLTSVVIGSLGDTVKAGAFLGQTSPPTSKVITTTKTLTLVNGMTVLANTSGGSFAVNLPAPTASNAVTAINTSTNTLTINPTSGAVIEGVGGSGTVTTSTQGTSLNLVADGTNWWITSSTGTFSFGSTLWTMEHGAINGHTPSSTFTPTASNTGATANSALYNGATFDGAMAYRDIGTTNNTASITFTYATEGVSSFRGVAVGLRWNHAGQTGCFASVANGQIWAYEMWGGSWTEAQAVAVPVLLTVGNTYTLTISDNGSIVTASIVDDTLLPITDPITTSNGNTNTQVSFGWMDGAGAEVYTFSSVITMMTV